MKFNRLAVFLGAVLLAIFATGCFFKSTDELYALPQQPDDYYDLQAAIEEVLSDGGQYCSPVSGANQQPVQMADLTGDGVDEAVVFVKTEGSKPLKTYVFERQESNYRVLCVIEGDGSAFDRVEYVQLDGKNGMELIIGRQVSNQVLQSISAYAIAEDQLVELLNATYSEFALADLDGNGWKDLFLLRFDAEARTGVAELYRYKDDALEREPEVPMSVEIDSVRHIQVGNLTEEQQALFVGSVTGETGVVTDIFAMRGQTFSTISSMRDLGLNSRIVRGYYVYSSDVDGDGVVELPQVVALPPRSAGEAEDPYYAIRWYNCDAEGHLSEKAFTYHNYASGWFLNLPESMEGEFAVSRGMEAHGVKGLSFFGKTSGDAFGDLLFTVYTFTGSQRNAYASEDGRLALGAMGDSAYSVSISPAGEAYGITADTISSIFHFIRVDWNSGET